METKKKIIVVTDGDKRACKAVEEAGKQLHLRTISASAGNPSPLMGDELVELIQQAPHDPVLVMVDDCGNPKMGDGETVLRYLGSHPNLEILGVVAVAANAPEVDGVEVDASVDCNGNLIQGPVYKNGTPEPEGHRLVEGDTVDVLNEMQVPVVIGIGDIGKMNGKDSSAKGSTVTTRAIQEILNRSGIQ